jgi:ribonuclease HI
MTRTHIDLLIVHTDGGSRGNPGPAAVGVVIERNGTVVYEYGATIGETTNNVAEYRALLAAWEWIRTKSAEGEISGGTVRFLLDSELVVKQLNGVYKIKDTKMRDLAAQVLNKSNACGLAYTYQSIPREQNREADALVNRALDGTLA